MDNIGTTSEKKLIEESSTNAKESNKKNLVDIKSPT